jgi:hypothetical protein
MFFAVRLERGGPSVWSLDLREPDGWDELARFMHVLVDDVIAIKSIEPWTILLDGRAR